MFRRLNHCSVPGYAPLCMDSNDPYTVQCGFAQRLLGEVPPTNTALISDLRAFVRDYCRSNLRKADIMSFEEWLDSTTYNDARKHELIEAHDALLGGLPTKRQCQHVDSFVKSEFYPTWKHARIINSRCDAFKVWSGPLFKSIENILYEQPQFIKHVPVPDRPSVIKNLRRAGAHYYQTDFTAFERHFVPEVLDAIECELYRHCLSGLVDVEYLCDALKGRNKMRTRTGISAEVEGRRMSGDMCTSLGNGFTNLMLALFIASRKHGTLDGVVEGDDGLFCSTVPISGADYYDLGFTIKIDEIDDPCMGSFCGMVFSESGEIIREPRRVMMGFGWTQSFLSAGPTIMDELLRAKALSSCYETPQCPIVGALARLGLRLTRGVKPRRVVDGYHCYPDEFNIQPFRPSADTRNLFEQLYGISVATQLACEDAIDSNNLALLSSLLPPTPEQYDYSTRYVEAT